MLKSAFYYLTAIIIIAMAHDKLQLLSSVVV